MHDPVRTIAPTDELVNLAEVKAHCRVDGDESDSLLMALISAATDHLDGWTGILGRCILPQTWRQDFDGFSQFMRLPLGPVISVSSVTHRNVAGQLSTVSSADYSLKKDFLGSYVRFKNDFTFPSDLNETGAVSITFVAGFDEVPPAIKAAALLLVSHWNENREATTEGDMAQIPLGVSALVAPYRRVGV